MNVRAPLLALLAALAFLLTSGPARAGYTHYWKWKTTPEPAAVAACVVEMHKIADAKRNILTDDQGHSAKEAHFTGTCAFGDAGETACIRFNGIGEGAHETFGFPLAPFVETPAFTFVKTAWKPYDVAVTACLIVARDHFPAAALEISSDGSWDNEWRDAAMLYTRVLGRFANNPLTSDPGGASGVGGTGGAGGAPGEPPPTTPPAGGRSRTQTLFIGVAVITLIVAAYAMSRKS